MKLNLCEKGVIVTSQVNNLGFWRPKTQAALSAPHEKALTYLSSLMLDNFADIVKFAYIQSYKKLKSNKAL